MLHAVFLIRQNAVFLLLYRISICINKFYVETSLNSHDAMQLLDVFFFTSYLLNECYCGDLNMQAKAGMIPLLAGTTRIVIIYLDVSSWKRSRFLSRSGIDEHGARN